jgi:hypothetical protein
MDIPSTRTIKLIAQALAAEGDCHAFVESGTFTGVTTRWAAKNFRAVFTIERYEPLFQAHSPELAALPNVTPLLGDSSQLIPVIAQGLEEFAGMYWLDAHWSGEGTAGEDNECPLLAELAPLAKRPQDIILIDDARLFLCAPPLPHKPGAWPSIAQVLQALGPGRHVQIVEDVIVAVPDEPRFVNLLTHHAQRQSTHQWQQRETGHTNARSLLTA